MDHPHFSGDKTVAQYFSKDGESGSWQLGKNSIKSGLGYYGKRPGYTKDEWENHFNNGSNQYFQTPKPQDN